MKATLDPRWAVNRSGIAQFFGISLPTVDSWIRSGLPALQRGSQGKPWQFDLRAVVAWRYAPKVETAAKLDPQHEKARLDAARADLAETQLGKVRGELVPAAEFERALSEPLKTVCVFHAHSATHSTGIRPLIPR